MSESARTTRRLEIESDLWEHYADRAAAGASPAETSVEALSRLLRGVPSDLAWRFQAEGFNVNIHFPVERIAGALLLFLLVPFFAGVSISGYDLSRETWSDEFARFADIPTWQRTWTAILHAAFGLGLIAATAQLLVSFRARSPRLVTGGCTFLVAAGITMLVNAAAYRAMSGLADEHLATGNTSVVATARAFGIVVETLAGANLLLSTLGVLTLGIALVRIELLPRWTVLLPVVGVCSPLIWVGLDPIFGDASWWAMGIGMLSVALWLLVCGLWLLLGGNHLQRIEPTPVSATAL